MPRKSTAARIYLTFDDVVEIQDHVLAEFGGLPGFIDQGRVHAAVGRLETGYRNNVFEQAAALMESVSNNRGFVDGNKRTGFILRIRSSG
jgi:death-on-curing protein